MRNLVLVVCLSVWGTLGGVEIALTFDDFPMGSSCIHTKEERVSLYVHQLNEAEVQAVFFCIGAHIDRDGGRELVEQLGDKHLLANHSYGHLHASQLSLDEFREDLYRVEELLSGFQNYRKWYRFPYLDYGNRKFMGGSEERRTEFRELLQAEGYRHGYVSLNTFDWYLNALVLEAMKEGKEIDWEAVRTIYLLLIEHWCVEQIAFKSEFSTHILLLHQNDLNALFLADIIDLIREKGWEIISAQAAYECEDADFSAVQSHPFLRPQCLSTLYIDQLIEQYCPF